MVEVTRRQFLQIGAAGAGVLGGVSPLGFDLTQATPIKQKLRIEGATVSHSVCPYCAVGLRAARVHPQGRGRQGRAAPDRGRPGQPGQRGHGCARRARARCSSPSPAAGCRARCTGRRARREWKQVSWDFALDKLARNIKASRDRTFVTTDADGNVGQPLRGHRVRRRRRVQLRGGLPRHEADARPRRRPPRATGPCLTRSHGGQFGRHVWPGGHDQPLA